jgi:DNA adenine methylase
MCQAKPFLKWAGGKGQLLEQFKPRFPKELNGAGIIKHYYEPFLGSGAVFFWVMQNCKIEKAYINELNTDVYRCYLAIQEDVDKVIRYLKSYQLKFSRLSQDEQSDFFYRIRDKYNSSMSNSAKNMFERCAMTIFLNRTCFNGLYRVNSKGKFNVPFGKYKNPTICNEENLRATSKILRRVKITNSDYSVVKKLIKPSSFVYFDPPYRPLNKTSSFTAYSSNTFDDDEQLRLSQTVKELNSLKEVKIMLSNSDPKNEDAKDGFFDRLYDGFKIERLSAKRMINCNASKRGCISEILVMNY